MTPVNRQRLQRLQRLLDYRRQRTTEAQQQLAAATQLVLSWEAQLESLDQARHLLGCDVERAGGQVIEPALLDASAVYLHWLNEQAECAQDHLAVAQSEEAQARDRLLTERKEERKIERLYDRWSHLLHRHTQQRELQQLDETALQRYRAQVNPEEQGA
jgi:flagellar export protein FliJ